VGYEGVTFLHQPDGALANDLALRELLVREIRTFRPDAVLATDPETLFHGDGGINHTDHQALFATTAALAADDTAERRPWHAALMAFVRDAADQAIQAGWLDVPVGNPFWDTFTLSQCRLIAASLAAAGFRFDGIDGWAMGRVPAYRDLTMAVASAGLEPRRIRAWPTQDEIAGLYRDVTVATDDFLAVHAPAMELDEVQAVLGTGGPDLARLWTSWDRVRAVFMEPVVAA
jgi:LmbE family N-acetylglucosaminyl deacetylase